MPAADPRWLAGIRDMTESRRINDIKPHLFDSLLGELVGSGVVQARRSRRLMGRHPLGLFHGAPVSQVVVDPGSRNEWQLIGYRMPASLVRPKDHVEHVAGLDSVLRFLCDYGVDSQHFRHSRLRDGVVALFVRQHRRLGIPSVTLGASTRLEAKASSQVTSCPPCVAIRPRSPASCCGPSRDCR